MRTIYTVGHSNGSFESFLRLLEIYSIQVVADVRSAPYTKYATHFNMERVKASLLESGLQYVYMGKQLGGMPKDQSLYDEDNNLDYAKVAAQESFKAGIERLVGGVETYKIALMCGEENPANCHRRRLLSPALKEQNIAVLHIRADGTVQDEDALRLLEEGVKDDPNAVQLKLF